MNDAAPAGATGSTKGLAFVGSFTTAERKARGTGIDAYRIDPRSRAWTLADHVGDIINPSFLHADPVRNVLYVAHGDAAFASAFAVDPATGKLRALGRVATGGQNGVSLTLDPTGRFLAVVNYSGGSVSVLPVRPDGALDSFSQCFVLPAGPVGPHRTEQTIPRPHHAVFDPSGRFLLIPDKGTDRILVAVLDGDHGALRVLGHASVRAGSGPRHLAFHPTLPRAFVVNEIDSTVVTCRWDAEAGVLTPLHVVPALSPGLLRRQHRGRDRGHALRPVRLRLEPGPGRGHPFCGGRGGRPAQRGRLDGHPGP